MPRVQQRTARKDYPRHGIKKGDVYFYAKIKQQRGGIELRSLKPFKPSQLTTSPFKGAWLSMAEAWEESDKDVDAIRAASETAQGIADEERGKYDNLPQGLQEGETGQKIEARADAAENLVSELDSLADELENLENPEDDWSDPEEPDEPEDHEADDYEELREAYDKLVEERDALISEHEESVSEYESEVERIQSEAGDLIGDMPE